MKHNEERLALLEAENASLSTNDKSTEVNASTRFRMPVNLMQSLDETPLATDTMTVLQQETGLPDIAATRTTVTQPLIPPSDPMTYPLKDDSNIELMVFKYFEAMEVMIRRLPQVAPLIFKSAPNNYADTPFTNEITLVEMSKNFTFPLMKMYDGTTYSDNHISLYKQRMFTKAIEREYREASMCKGFSSSLTGPALQWLTNLPNTSIESIVSLTDRFVEKFARSRNLENTIDDLYEVQTKEESLCSYVGRFNKEKVSIPSCVTYTAISALKRVLL